MDDSSFELSSTMSPKINRNHKPVKKAPTILALKKYFRKSLGLSNANPTTKDISIIEIESSSSSYKSTESKISNATPIVISDSEKSLNKEESSFSLSENKDCMKPYMSKTRLSKEKYANIQTWVDEVNNAKQGLSQYGNNNLRLKKEETNISTSSILLKKPESSPKNCELLINNGLESDFENITINDSFHISKDSLSTRIHNKQATNSEENHGDSSEWENLLDSLYGHSWREKKEEILPTSERKVQKIRTKVNKKIANTERCPRQIPKQDNNLLNILQKARFKKALESPWAQSLENVCDSDSEPEDAAKHLPAIRLDFEDKDSTSDNTTKKRQAQKSKPKEDCKTDETHSFLASLSGNTPVEKCDVSALIFRKNFKQHKEVLASKLFSLYNDKVFDNSIPKDTPLEWSDRMVRTAGTCTCKKITRRTGVIERTVKIVLSSKVLDSPDRLRDTLIHEMCHAATWIVNEISDGHGSFWKSWACRAMKVFPELPSINRCHNYVIDTKYTYKCTGCGYSIGRHTKSLDVQRKRCGYCYGTFEVLINKTSKQGETKSVPATPKKVTGFALFVKENYANFKTPSLKHADVMKILGQKFANLKVDQS